MRRGNASSFRKVALGRAVAAADAGGGAVDAADLPPG